ncbi:MAG: SynChlorMet cassette radical SAM/SPASM protein ScmF [Deltaproteobacteria bacterium]|nr:SynChlorMet cassette radical SAM/SPASM protein ScmF [Deltaproteobacteria bacterium]
MSTEKTAALEHPLTQLYFFLTGGCNLRCRHCWIAPHYQETPRPEHSLDFELLQRIIRQAKPLGLSAVKLTGGEPLLHPRIRDILSFLRAENLGLMLETNAVLVTPELARLIAAFPELLVSVSLDSHRAEVHEWVRGREGCFADTLTGIRRLVEAGVTPQIIMTLMRRNRDDVEAIIPFARNLGAVMVKYNIVQPQSRGEHLYETDEALTIPEIVELGRWVELELSRRAPLHLYFHQPPAFQPLSRMIHRGDLSCNACGILNILGVLPDGSWALCGLSEDVPELIFGHAAADPVEEVWRDTPLLRELRRGLPHRLEGVCGDCLQKTICLGSCIAHNYTRTRSLWAPFWFCREAEAAGLFPASRRRSPAVGPDGPHA